MGKIMSLGYWSAQGFDTDKIKEQAKPNDVKETALGTLYRVHIEESAEGSVDRERHLERAVATPVQKRKGPRGTTPRATRAKLPKKGSNPEHWTPEENEN